MVSRVQEAGDSSVGFLTGVRRSRWALWLLALVVSVWGWMRARDGVAFRAELDQLNRQLEGIRARARREELRSVTGSPRRGVPRPRIVDPVAGATGQLLRKRLRDAAVDTKSNGAFTEGGWADRLPRSGEPDTDVTARPPAERERFVVPGMTPPSPPDLEGWFRTPSSVKVLVAEAGEHRWVEEGESLGGWEFIHFGDGCVIFRYEILRREWGPIWVACPLPTASR